MIWIIAAAAWGATEASFFFVVPDVLLTLATLRFGLRRGLTLSVIAAATATLAGLAMWRWGIADPDSARNAMLLIPAIEPALLARAHAEVQHDWAWHLFAGSLSGVPYKLYAVEAGTQGIDPILFAFASFGTRLAQFMTTVSAAALVRQVCDSPQRHRLAYSGWAMFWIALYAVYWIWIAPL